MRESLDKLESRIKYSFSEISLLETALTHRSVSMRNNERSEFLGDSILGFVIAEQLFLKFRQADEGQLSRLRASLVKKETLADISRELAIGNFMKLGQGELRSGGHRRDSILADAFEAIIAAIYLDGGYEKARQFILTIYQQRLASVTLEKGDKDPKTRLQELLQSKKIDLPDYQVLDATGPQHKQQFTVRCKIASQSRESVGHGESKRKAEQAAAEKMLEQYKDE